MKNKKGVSLVTLVITVIILIIIATVTMSKLGDRTDRARIAKQNTNFALIQEEVENYINSNDGNLPIKKDISNNPVTYTVTPNSSLYNEMLKNSEQNDTFYVIDLKKMGKTHGDTGENRVPDDVYIVSAEKHNVYYAKGVVINGVIYHSVVIN